MPDLFDLDGYLRRIGFEDVARPDLETLSAIHALHVAAIPFEGIDPLIGRPAQLDVASLQAKMVRSRRGGYCFEQNVLLKTALEAIGFSVTGLAGRVVWMGDGATPGPRSHMLLRIDLPEGLFLADVGFGAHLLDAPLRLETDLDQPTAAAVYRIERDGDAFALAAHDCGSWRRVYVFNLEPQLAPDYDMANWYMSTHPDSLFTKMLIVERLTGEVRRNLVNTWLIERWRDGRVEERNLSSAEDLAETLDRLFGIDLPGPAAELFAKISFAA